MKFFWIIFLSLFIVPVFAEPVVEEPVVEEPVVEEPVVEEPVVEKSKPPIASETIVGIASAIIAITVGGITWHYQRKNLEFNALLHLHELLNSKDNRSYRKYVIERWSNYIPEKIIHEEEFREKGEKIMNDWDEIGILIYRKLDLKTKKPARFGGYIPKDVFFTAYAGAVVNSWIVLEELKNQLSKERDATIFKLYFQKLYEDAMEFREKFGSGETSIQKLDRERKEEQQSKKEKSNDTRDKTQQDPEPKS
ncbi:hypothetical protein NsoK4_03500 [Nitrosopumilus sp. K4]|uniref:hypothetical protein n=1 Tax=Nitrosopumilus sp. K4 TaxID=2795383 RepID=UPI001BAB6A65|nr:hypothetical protein [Nitrosopumilus sp. K4]QUC65323.1 hypothetical protein NsoK4_03500 [Nitrosopumilus sp. K4]